MFAYLEGSLSPARKECLVPQTSAIEWTEATWNPVTGCSQVSPGCAHCYAKTFASGGEFQVTRTSRDSSSGCGQTDWRSRRALEKAAHDLRELDV